MDVVVFGSAPSGSMESEERCECSCPIAKIGSSGTQASFAKFLLVVCWKCTVRSSENVLRCVLGKCE